ncbi:MAG: YhdT family protein [Coriobacteriales bacterium]
MTYKEKLKQADREARAALVGLAATIVVWLLLGFGVAQTGIEVFSTPLWVFTGCLGTFACAIIVSLVMAKRVFKDVALDEVEPISGQGEGDGDAR